jgi:hypothetical protein
VHHKIGCWLSSRVACEIKEGIHHLNSWRYIQSVRKKKLLRILRKGLTTFSNPFLKKCIIYPMHGKGTLFEIFKNQVDKIILP